MATNPQRVAATRAALIGAARPLFAAQGFGATSTEAILAAAGLTRGALYHHFQDKTALFDAVCQALCAEAAAAVETAASRAAAPMAALHAGALAWVDFMIRPESRQILLLDAPTVLGLKRWTDLDEAGAGRLLAQGVAAARRSGDMAPVGTLEDFVALLNGALNGLALRLAMESHPRSAWAPTVEDFLARFAGP